MRDLENFFDAHHAHKQYYSGRPEYNDYEEDGSRDELFNQYYHHHEEHHHHPLMTLSNWNCSDPTSPEYIKNKPNLVAANSIKPEDIAKWNELCEKYPKIAEHIKELVKDRHNHSNIDVLEKLTEDVINNSHTHKNLNLLESISESNLEILNSITKDLIKSWNDNVSKSCNIDHRQLETIIKLAHNHENKLLLDSIKAENVHEHLNKDALNLISLEDIIEWQQAYNKMHEHENKCALDLITCESIKLWNQVSNYFELQEDGKLHANYDLVIPTTIEVVDNLESTETRLALSANQGRILKMMINYYEEGTENEMWENI